jgi:hypothetical protein
VADRLALDHGPAGHVQGAWFALDGTEGAAVGAGSLFAQGLGLLFQQSGEGAFGEARRGGAGQLLHGVEIGVEARAGIAKGAAANDFAPPGGEVADFLEEFGRKFTACHGRYYLVLAANGEEEFRPGSKTLLFG